MIENIPLQLASIGHFRVSKVQWRLSNQVANRAFNTLHIGFDENPLFPNREGTELSGITPPFFGFGCDLFVETVNKMAEGQQKPIELVSLKQADIVTFMASWKA